jgi:hypothetical protein
MSGEDAGGCQMRHVVLEEGNHSDDTLQISSQSLYRYAWRRMYGGRREDVQVSHVYQYV